MTSPVLQEIDATGLHVLAWVEDGVIKLKTLALSELQAEHDAHHDLTHPADPLNHPWPSPVAFDLARAKCAVLRAKLVALAAKI